MKRSGKWDLMIFEGPFQLLVQDGPIPHPSKLASADKHKLRCWKESILPTLPFLTFPLGYFFCLSLFHLLSWESWTCQIEPGLPTVDIVSPSNLPSSLRRSAFYLCIGISSWGNVAGFKPNVFEVIQYACEGIWEKSAITVIRCGQWFA